MDFLSIFKGSVSMHSKQSFDLKRKRINCRKHIYGLITIALIWSMSVYHVQGLAEFYLNLSREFSERSDI